MPGIGAEAAEWMAQLRRVGGSISWIDDVEDELGQIRRGKSGERVVEYPYGKVTQQTLRDSLVKQATMTIAPGTLALAAPHPGGGCRMGSDPASSVVDSSHRVHGVKNLFVADSSVFPTSSSLDPSLSIMAFSYIAAAHIAGCIKR